MNNEKLEINNDTNIDVVENFISRIASINGDTNKDIPIYTGSYGMLIFNNIIREYTKQSGFEVAYKKACINKSKADKTQYVKYSLNNLSIKIILDPYNDRLGIDNVESRILNFKL